MQMKVPTGCIGLAVQKHLEDKCPVTAMRTTGKPNSLIFLL